MRDERVAWLAVGWAVLTVPLLGLFALSVPAVYARKLEPTPAVRVGLEQLGLSVTWYAAWWSTVLLTFAVVCFAVAALIVARRPRERAAWFAALFLVTLGAANAPSMEALVWQRPDLEGAATLAFQLLLACLLFLFTFPDGRFQPRWSWLVVAGALAALVPARGLHRLAQAAFHPAPHVRQARLRSSYRHRAADRRRGSLRRDRRWLG